MCVCSYVGSPAIPPDGAPQSGNSSVLMCAPVIPPHVAVQAIAVY